MYPMTVGETLGQTVGPSFFDRLADDGELAVGADPPSPRPTRLCGVGTWQWVSRAGAVPQRTAAAEQGRHEVDLLGELAGGRLVGIEVKAGASPTERDARHLAWLRDELGERFRRRSARSGSKRARMSAIKGAAKAR